MFYSNFDHTHYKLLKANLRKVNHKIFTDHFDDSFFDTPSLKELPREREKWFDLCLKNDYYLNSQQVYPFNIPTGLLINVPKNHVAYLDISRSPPFHGYTLQPQYYVHEMGVREIVIELEMTGEIPEKIPKWQPFVSVEIRKIKPLMTPIVSREENPSEGNESNRPRLIWVPPRTITVPPPPAPPTPDLQSNENNENRPRLIWIPPRNVTVPPIVPPPTPLDPQPFQNSEQSEQQDLIRNDEQNNQNNSEQNNQNNSEDYVSKFITELLES